jgi:hypothetical protein
MEGDMDRESQLLTDVVEWILTPVTAGGLFPCSHGDNQRALPVDLCHLAREIHDFTTPRKITSSSTTEHRLFWSFFLIKFLMRACGDGGIAPCIIVGHKWI